MSQFIRYAVGGSIIYWAEVFLTVTITELTGLWFIYSFLISLVLGLVALFFFHKHITFECRSIKNITVLYFIIVTLMVYVGWFTTSYVLHALITTHYLFVMIGSSLPFSLAGYFVNKLWIFRS